MEIERAIPKHVLSFFQHASQVVLSGLVGTTKWARHQVLVLFFGRH